MDKEQGSEATTPASTHGSSTLDAYADFCADLCERVLADDGFTWEDAANALFGPEPEITYTRWSA